MYRDLLDRFTRMSRDVFAENLVGVYLHGSWVMGCFNPEKSDLDLILVVDRDIPDNVKIEFIRNVVKLNEEAPKKGFELSIVKREFCRPFVYPTPYELHFSPMYVDLFLRDPKAYIEKLRGTDRDLAAHFTIIKKYGVVLFGEAVEDVFGSVPPCDYIDSIIFDIENAREDILSNPMYVTLNLCRVLAYLRCGLILSKKAGGEWAAEALTPQFRAPVIDALRCYESDAEMQIDRDTALAFAAHMTDEINRSRILT